MQLPSQEKPGKHFDIGAQNMLTDGAAKHAIFFVHGADTEVYDAMFEKGFERGRIFVTDWQRYQGKQIAPEITTEPKVKESAPAGLLIDMLVPAARAEDMLLTLSNAFEQRWLPKYGPRRARLFFLLQSTGAVIGYWINWIKKNLDVLKFFAS
jgi:hypothetical protein